MASSIPLTSAKCKEMLDLHFDALSTVLKSNQSYTIGGRSLSRANLGEIQSGITYWQTKYEEALKLEANGGRRGTVVRSVILHG